MRRAVCLSLALTACGSSSAKDSAGTRPAAVTPSVPVADAAAAAAPAPAEKPASGSFADWLRPKVPEGGALVASGDGVRVVHSARAGDTAASIAEAYLDLTSVYYAKDLAALITKDHPSIEAGTKVEIPKLLTEPYKDPEQERLRWPEDKSLRAIFVTGAFAGVQWPQTLDRMANREMNAVVLDGKDYMGPVTYPSKAKVAVETLATTKGWDHGKPPIPDLARAIRFAHARGIRIIMRIACFHDPWSAKRADRLSIQGTWGKPYPMGWLDPVNTEAQDYVIELAKEMMDAGADEIQLDYVRFPVHSGLKSAIMPPGNKGHRINAIRDFVRRVHAVTEARKVPLSLDIFGVAASGERSDIEMLGQDVSVLGKECEALSPMVYPSHYADGYRGFAVPGNHPEIVGIGTKGAVDQLKAAKVKGTVIRSWLQAFAWKTPAYGPKYLVEEARSAEKAGGVGWLMWSPGCEYGAAWSGFPPVKK
jgi:hypothetical protein